MTQNQAVSAGDITAWLSDLERHSKALQEAILRGDVVVTTKTSFEQVLDKTKKAFEDRKTAEERAENLQLERDELAFSLVCILKSFEGIAAGSDDMVQIAKLVGVGEDGKMPSKMKMGIAAVGNINQIIATASKIIAGFRMEWLLRINFERVSALLSVNNHIDLSGYAQLGAALKQISQPNPPQLDETHG